MARYGETASGLSPTAVNSIAQAVAKGVQAGMRADKAIAMNPAAERRKQYASGLQKEAALARALTTEAGLRKIAANIDQVRVR